MAMTTPPPLRRLRPAPPGPGLLRRIIGAGALAGIVAGAVLIGMGCGGSGASVEVSPSQAAPGGPSSLQVPDPPPGRPGFDPRTLAALPAGGGDPKAIRVPGLPITLDGSLGLSTTVTPTLSWPDGPSSGVDWSVTDLAGEQVAGQSGGESTFEVPRGALKGGSAYLWKATSGEQAFGPHLMRVDLQRADVQGVIDYAGVGVAAVTGEPVMSISTPALATVSGPVSVSLAYQPTNRLSAATTPGVPAGWQITSSTSAPWTLLRRPAEDRIELTDASGQVVPFRQVSPGAWVADWGAGQNWPAGQYAVLAQAQGVGDAPFQITERSGQVTTFPATAPGARSWPSSTWSAKNPAPRSDYDGSGRLVAITDPVSARTIRLAYGGSGSCPSPAGDGLTSAPKGMLCRVSGWDGSITDILYATRGGDEVIARVITDAQAGGTTLAQTDIGYDAAGRPDRIRSPLANSAIAARVLPGQIGARDPAVMTSIAYDDQGRVATITRPAAILTATQGTVPEQVARTFTYPGAGQITVAQPGRSEPISTSQASPATMLTTRTTDSLGRVSEATWDQARQAPTEITQPGGMVTRYSYDALGRPRQTTGPSSDVGSSSAPQTTLAYDTQPSQGSDGQPVPIEGVMATYWTGAAFQGTPAGASIGPRIDGDLPDALDIRWPQSPVGQGAFSARLEGLLIVPEGGIRQIANTTPSSQVWIDAIRCEEACPDTLGLERRAPGDILQVRIDIRSSEAGVATAGLSWTTGEGTSAIPASALRPGLPQPTATTVRDQLTPDGQVTSITTQSTFSAADPQQITAARSASGKVATRAYEPYAPGSGAFGRATGYTSPARDTTTTSYYAPGQAPQTSCAGAAANQGGLIRSKATPGGLSIGQSYDPAGRLIGQSATGTNPLCNTYDAAGALIRSATGPVVTTYDYAVDSNPMHQRSATTQDATTRTSAQVIDLLGRTVRSRDVWGTVAVTSYDSEDRPVQVRTTTAKGQSTTSTYAYTADGQIQQITRDGQALAQMGYEESTGRLSGAEYANGSSMSLSYDANGSVSERTLDIGGQGITEQVSLSPAGRTMTRQISGAGADASWQYSYDEDGRLTRAALSGSAPYGVRTGTWAYALNNASERTRITSPYTPTDGFTYSYARSGALTATSDTRFGNRFTYDPAGRATRAGDITLAYDPTGAVERISDGAVSESRVLSGGTIIATAITTPDGQKAIRYSSSGLMLTTAGLIDSQMVPLPGDVSVQLPPPAAPKDTGGPAQAATTAPATTAPATTAPATTQAAPTTTPAATTGAVPATTQEEPAPAPATTETAPATGPAPLPIWRYSDLQGSVAWSSTADQAPSDTTLYDPDGNRLGTPPALSRDPSRPNLLFEGADTAPLTVPVAQMGARSYVPALGIFLQPDPIPNGSSTPYNYAAGDPINASDVTGTSVIFGAQWWKENWAASVGIAAAVVAGLAVGAVTGGTGTVITWKAIGIAMPSRLDQRGS